MHIRRTWKRLKIKKKLLTNGQIQWWTLNQHKWIVGHRGSLLGLGTVRVFLLYVLMLFMYFFVFNRICSSDNNPHFQSFSIHATERAHEPPRKSINHFESFDGRMHMPLLPQVDSSPSYGFREWRCEAIIFLLAIWIFTAVSWVQDDLITIRNHFWMQRESQLFCKLWMGVNEKLSHCFYCQGNKCFISIPSLWNTKLYTLTFLQVSNKLGSCCPVSCIKELTGVTQPLAAMLEILRNSWGTRTVNIFYFVQLGRLFLTANQSFHHWFIWLIFF